MTGSAPDDRGQVVHLSVDRHVATVTLDSPHNRNALSQRLVRQLLTSLTAAAEQTDVRVVVLTHTGTTFCAGADLREAAELGMEEGTRSLLTVLRAVVELPVPVMAVVRGHVRAGGIGLVGACDLALASERSTFAFTEVLLGLAPALISLTTRSRLSDRAAARSWLTGTPFDGLEAERLGLVTRTAPEVELDAAVAALLSDLGKASGQGLRETKALLNGPLLRRFDAEGEALLRLSARLFASEEASEGMAAFRERRLPRWALPLT